MFVINKCMTHSCLNFEYYKIVTADLEKAKMHCYHIKLGTGVQIKSREQTLFSLTLGEIKNFPLVLIIFSCKSDSTIANVRSFVCLFVIKTPNSLKSSSCIIHPSSFFIPHSSFLHFATFKLFSLLIFQSILWIRGIGWVSKYYQTNKITHFLN